MEKSEEHNNEEDIFSEIHSNANTENIIKDNIEEYHENCSHCNNDEDDNELEELGVFEKYFLRKAMRMFCYSDKNIDRDDEEYINNILNCIRYENIVNHLKEIRYFLCSVFKTRELYRDEFEKVFEIMLSSDVEKIIDIIENNEIVKKFFDTFKYINEDILVVIEEYIDKNN